MYCFYLQPREDTISETVTEPKNILAERILLCKGNVAVKRLIAKSFDARKRPAADQIQAEMNSLIEAGIGTLCKKGQAEGFLKPPRLTEAQCEKHGIAQDAYAINFNCEEKNLSKNQQKVFHELHSQQYPQ